MLESSFGDYSDTYILLKGTISVAAAAANKNYKKLMFKVCAPFTNFMSKMNIRQIDNAKEIDVVKPIYILIKLMIIIQKYQEIYGNFIETSQI